MNTETRGKPSIRARVVLALLTLFAVAAKAEIQTAIPAALMVQAWTGAPQSDAVAARGTALDNHRGSGGAPLAYPNPCGANGADIQFALAKRERVEAALYSVTGVLVRNLLPPSTLTTGVYQVSWNGKDNCGRKVAAGTFLCRITAGDVQHVLALSKSR